MTMSQQEAPQHVRNYADLYILVDDGKKLNPQHGSNHRIYIWP